MDPANWLAERKKQLLHKQARLLKLFAQVYGLGLAIDILGIFFLYPIVPALFWIIYSIALVLTVVIFGILFALSVERGWVIDHAIEVERTLDKAA